jgi:hypothetical protein
MRGDVNKLSERLSDPVKNAPNIGVKVYAT